MKRVLKKGISDDVSKSNIAAVKISAQNRWAKSTCEGLIPNVFCDYQFMQSV
jgi:hypothetical protein